MILIAKAVYRKNRATTTHAYPYSFMISRITGSIFAILFPVIIYKYLFDKTVTNEFLQYTGTNDYIAYIVLGQAIDILSFSTLMNVGRCLITEIREGTLEPFITTSASRMQYFVGAYLEQFGRSLIEYVLVITFGYLIGMTISPIKILGSVGIVCISSLAFFSISIFFSTVMVYTRDTYIVQNTAMLCMECLCGVVFPTQYLPGILQKISLIFPLTPALKIYRNCILLNESIFEQWYLLLHLLVLSLIYIYVGYYGFRKIEVKLIEEVYS